MHRPREEHRMTTRRALLAARAATALPRPSGAAEWQPDRPVTMIVAFAAGGGTDTAARTLARFMERDLGQSVVVVNRPGAGGEIGWAELARAKPDGHTIGFTNTPNILTVPIERQARFRFEDRKSTRLNSSHANISYAVFCLKKKKNTSYLHMCHRIQCLAVI